MAVFWLAFWSVCFWSGSLISLGRCAEQSVSLLDVTVTMRRTVNASGDGTSFRLAGALKSVDVNNAWMAVGLNSRNQMVSFSIQKKTCCCLEK